MALSKRARAVSAIGREIETALGSHRSTDVLTRWMAYRLAEVRLAVEASSTAEDRKSALAEQDALIMELWAQRGTLPHSLGVDRRVGSAAEIIEQLLSDPDQWRGRPDPPRGAVETLGAFSDAREHLLRVAAALIFKREAAQLGPEDSDLPLTKQERADRASWADFSDIILRGLTSGTGPMYGQPAPTDAEAIVLLEKGTVDAIEKLRNYLAALEAMLLPDRQVS